MATHPYISGVNNVSQMITYLKKNFPQIVTSETVKKLGLASNNESYVINALQFLRVIDEEGKRTDAGHDAFVKSGTDFEEAFEPLVRDAYKELFDLRGDDAWTMTRPQLVGYFRQSDKTSDVIGGRQANLFMMFRSLAGHGDPITPAVPKTSKAKNRTATPKKPKAMSVTAPAGAKAAVPKAIGGEQHRDMALTVRVEINLPAGVSKEDYDNIFKSIRDNLLGA